jgi:hypothetical protein
MQAVQALTGHQIKLERISSSVIQMNTYYRWCKVNNTKTKSTRDHTMMTSSSNDQTGIATTLTENIEQMLPAQMEVVVCLDRS